MKKNYKNKEDFIIKQLKDTLAKIQGAINLIDTSTTHFARNKMLGVYQKIGYILQKVSQDWQETNENNKDT
jgi:hypothetical protein